ncbi:MAG: hypothetical protein EA341_08180 [Mongoliibacter sp.]|uniref:hypothetical protein n=1 Tax=Mongoliibacter sp. TaxID=2022438 RepID=UPI0012F3E0A0|nr:hypothetical protein [Mongoliibacter sp.]TVP50108.1 MAG: hypothetical protein EA341_08180 [Mongoliibacter sp.]
MTSIHAFHIPVMGLGFTVDSPLKVAKFGISSVVSIMDDHLLEDMRRLYSRERNIPYLPIEADTHDYRAERIRKYLDLLNDVVNQQIREIKNQPFSPGSSLYKYFDLLHPRHPLYLKFRKFLGLLESSEKTILEQELLNEVKAGYIDVNIMTKVDKINFDKQGNEMPRTFSDALSALRGFALSSLQSSVVFSAGMNPALYSYIEEFDDFFPDSSGKLKKKIILKVSDYRSALIQGRFLAKKGIWVSEFRIESGLNCGGHAFATEGMLIGPILEEFKREKANLSQILFSSCQHALEAKGKCPLPVGMMPKITYQGGIGSSEENEFLMTYYQLDGTGWGSPFLLVPEATSVDKDTLDRLIQAKNSDYFLSHASPLGVPFNNLRTSSGEEQRKTRIKKNRPGSPCYKKFLTFSTEFTEKAICTASRQYQDLKIKQFKSGNTSKAELEEVLEKDCLCEGLSAPAILNAGGTPRRNLNAVTICPGPNLAYFKGIFSLSEMVNHIYGKVQLNLQADRPHVFIKELQLYFDYLKKDIQKNLSDPSKKYEAYLKKFKSNLMGGIEYYQSLENQFSQEAGDVKNQFLLQLDQMKKDLEATIDADGLHISFS